MSENKKRLLIAGIYLLVLVLVVAAALLLIPGKTKKPANQPASYEQLEEKPGENNTNKPENEPENPGENETEKPEEEPENPGENENDDPEEEPENPGENENDDPEEEPENPGENENDDPEEQPEKPGENENDDPEEQPENPGENETDKPEEQPENPGENENDDPEEEPEDPQEPNEDPEEITPPPPETPPIVEIPGEDEVTGLQFPCEVPGHNLVIEKLAPYSGLFVEDGTNVQVTDIAMLLVCNKGDSAVEYTEITVEYPEKTLSFHISALPAGESMVVQEKTGSTVPKGVPMRASALVIHRTQMGIASELSVTDNGDNSLTVKNLTEETIPAVRVFYKYYMEEEDLFVGGIAFTVRITSLAGGGSVVIRPSHYTSQTSRVVMALTYDA